MCFTKKDWEWNESLNLADGDLNVNCRYEMNSHGAMLIELAEHILVPRTQPSNYEELLLSIQRSVPFQYFDPSETVMITTVSFFIFTVILNSINSFLL
jgi:hypothetical protein